MINLYINKYILIINPYSLVNDLIIKSLISAIRIYSIILYYFYFYIYLYSQYILFTYMIIIF
jgi:hypothetical protein